MGFWVIYWAASFSAYIFWIVLDPGFGPGESSSEEIGESSSEESSEDEESSELFAKACFSFLA